MNMITKTNESGHILSQKAILEPVSADKAHDTKVGIAIVQAGWINGVVVENSVIVLHNKGHWSNESFKDIAMQKQATLTNHITDFRQFRKLMVLYNSMYDKED